MQSSEFGHKNQKIWIDSSKKNSQSSFYFFKNLGVLEKSEKNVEAKKIEIELRA